MLCLASAQARERKLTTKNRFILTCVLNPIHATIKHLKIFSTSLTCWNMYQSRFLTESKYQSISALVVCQSQMGWLRVGCCSMIWVYRNHSRQTVTKTRYAQHLPLLKSSTYEWSEAQSIWTQPLTSSSLTYPLSLVSHFQVIHLSSSGCEEINYSQFIYLIFTATTRSLK